jgi:hypothetical protein
MAPQMSGTSAPTCFVKIVGSIEPDLRVGWRTRPSFRSHAVGGALVAMTKCGKCGYDNDARLRFCDLCKFKLEVAAKPAAAPPVPEGASFSSAPRRSKEVVPDTERRYLVPPSGTPTLLAIGATAVIGRDDAATVKLISGKVSRQHAELRWNGTACFICDLGSQNGTAVNGERLQSKGVRELKNKDEIEIGGVPMVYRILPPGVPESELSPDNKATEAAFAKNDALAGAVDIVPLSTILERLQTLGATGTLRVATASNTTGQLRLEKGTPIYGTFGKEVGDAAVASIARLVEGRFRFDRET